MSKLYTDIRVSAYVQYSDRGIVESVIVGRAEMLPFLSDDEIIKLQQKWVSPSRSLSPTAEDYARHMDKVANTDYDRLLKEVVK